VAALLLQPLSAYNVSTLDCARGSPLHVATRQGHTQTVALLLGKGVRVDDRDAHGDTPLHLAVKASGLEIASMLLMAKANPRVNDAQGLTPLAGAVLALRGPAVAHLFHRHGLWLGEQQLARVLALGSTPVIELLGEMLGPLFVKLAEKEAEGARRVAGVATGEPSERAGSRSGLLRHKLTQ